MSCQGGKKKKTLIQFVTGMLYTPPKSDVMWISTKLVTRSIIYLLSKDHLGEELVPIRK